MGVIELEPRALERLDVIDFGAIEVEHTGLIYKDAEIAEPVSLIEHVGLSFESHRIAEAGTTAANDRNPQTSGPGLLYVRGSHSLCL